jgi:large subunit ribosomal protein L33
MKWGKKKVFKIVRLVSTAATGFVYTKKKSSKITDKLQQLKYDPRVKRHVLFEEVN